LDSESGGPIAIKNVNAYQTILMNVDVDDWSNESALWRLERVLLGKLDAEVKHPAFIRCVSLPFDDGSILIDAAAVSDEGEVWIRVVDAKVIFVIESFDVIAFPLVAVLSHYDYQAQILKLSVF
jgi:hypothetical protein